MRPHIAPADLYIETSKKSWKRETSFSTDDGGEIPATDSEVSSPKSPLKPFGKPSPARTTSRPPSTRRLSLERTSTQLAPDVQMRVFLLDNSGSTKKLDGRVLITEDHHVRAVDTDRWSEIISIAVRHAEWNVQHGLRSQFVLLNPHSPHNPVEGRDYVTLDPKLHEGNNQVAWLSQVLRRNGPCGNTPMTSRLRQLRLRMQRVRRLALTIVTDGLPTSESSTVSSPADKAAFVKEIQSWASTFQCTPVIRLTTSQASALKYYRRINEEVDFHIEVLDDLQAEAKAANARGNGWLAYTPAMHRVRESGATESIFWHLTERSLTQREVVEVLEFIFKEKMPSKSVEQLLEAVARESEKAHAVYNGRLQCMSPPVDLLQLKKALGIYFSLSSMTREFASVVAKKMPQMTCRSRSCDVEAHMLLQPNLRKDSRCRLNVHLGAGMDRKNAEK